MSAHITKNWPPNPVMSPYQRFPAPASLDCHGTPGAGAPLNVGFVANRVTRPLDACDRPRRARGVPTPSGCRVASRVAARGVLGVWPGVQRVAVGCVLGVWRSASARVRVGRVRTRGVVPRTRTGTRAGRSA